MRGRHAKNSSFSQGHTNMMTLDMMIPVAYDDHLYVSDPLPFQETGTINTTYPRRGKPKRARTPLIIDKIKQPVVTGLIERPRITELLERGSERFVANMISGRSRTGKTAAAVNFASKYDSVAWFTVDSSDTVWPVFANYLQTSTLNAAFGDRSHRLTKIPSGSGTEEDIASFLIRLITKIVAKDRPEPMLVVFDDLHHVFDADWFADFFPLLLHSFNPAIDLLLICRGKPPLPLWRLRSKQLLNVVDEKVLLFDLPETVELYEKHGSTAALAKQAFSASFGRPGKIVDLVQAEMPSTL